MMGRRHLNKECGDEFLFKDCYGIFETSLEIKTVFRKRFQNRSSNSTHVEQWNEQYIRCKYNN